MKRLVSAALAALLTLPLSVQAAEGQQRMDQFLAGLKTMRAAFAQTVVDPDGATVEETSGELLVSRPDRFRLQYTAPYEQLYVADGKQVWMYDKDLEQVTVKKQGEALGSTPALLLSSTAPLTKNFDVTELGAREGLTWIELNPKRQDASFESVQLALEDSTLRVMEMVDGFGQRTRLQFERIERNPRLDADAFRFTPPKGVDVIGENE
ncbi:MAG: outer membrane lipoprotein chaperone LolA [Thiohalomonadaceae bacterium]